MATRNKQTGSEPKADRSATEPSAAVVVVLDDGSHVEYGSEAEAREAHPRAWVRSKAEVAAERADGDD